MLKRDDRSETTIPGHLPVQQLIEAFVKKSINHLVLAGRDLTALRSAYQALGFTVKPRGRLPFGISNSIVQLQGSYLELLSVTGDVPEHSPENFSFGAFNRDYLARLMLAAWPGAEEALDAAIAADPGLAPANKG